LSIIFILNSNAELSEAGTVSSLLEVRDDFRSSGFVRV